MLAPRGYAQQKRADLKGRITNEMADLVLARWDPEFVVRTAGDMFSIVPKKYHARIQDALLTAYVRELFRQSTFKFSLAMRRQFLQDVLKYSANHRER